jgi:serine/threonine protein kinase
LEHIHSLNYVYRDLKPENILLAEDGHIKLIDFGFARPADSSTRMHTICGTPAYLSPEQLDQKFTNGYTNSCDWWSFGIVIYELYIGVTPFCTSSRPLGALSSGLCCGSNVAGHMERDGASHYEIFLRILKNKIYFPSGIDSQAKDLVQSLCHPQIDKRLTNVHAIAKHSYFEIPWEIGQLTLLLPSSYVFSHSYYLLCCVNSQGETSNSSVHPQN